MSRVFEAVVEQAARDALSNSDWTVTVRDGDGNLRLVGDAKWKTETIYQSDVYQMTSYRLADDVPGVPVYPSQNGNLETEYEVDGLLPLHAVELPTAPPTDGFDEFTTWTPTALKTRFDRLTANS